MRWGRLGLAWEDVGARFSDVVSLISVGYWSFDMILSFQSTAAHKFERMNSHGSAGTASQVLSNFNKEHRFVLSLHVLASMRTASKVKWWQKSLREWELEVRSYKSSLLFVNKEPERVVFLSAIKVRSW